MWPVFTRISLGALKRTALAASKDCEQSDFMNPEQGGTFATAFRTNNCPYRLDFTRFRRHISTSSSKLLESQRAQLV